MPLPQTRSHTTKYTLSVPCPPTGSRTPPSRIPGPTLLPCPAPLVAPTSLPPALAVAPAELNSIVVYGKEWLAFLCKGGSHFPGPKTGPEEVSYSRSQKICIKLRARFRDQRNLTFSNFSLIVSARASVSGTSRPRSESSRFAQGRSIHHSRVSLFCRLRPSLECCLGRCPRTWGGRISWEVKYVKRNETH